MDTTQTQRQLACLLAGIAAAMGCAAADGGAPIRLRVVGGLAGVHQYTRNEEPFWTRELPRLSKGRLSADIVPFDQAGIRGQEMLRLMAAGTVPFGTVLLSRSQAVEPELGAVDLAGMNPDMATLRRHVAAFRPRLVQLLRERHGVELLAVYVYPSQVTFCARPFAGLGDLAARRVRVGSVAQADLVRALGALPVQIEFADIVPAVRAGTVDCVMTGSMSGNTIGLHEVTTHVDRKAVTWGVSVFGANLKAWGALPEADRVLLQHALERLEQAIWAESERESADGLNCNTGTGPCVEGRAGRMSAVAANSLDERRLRDAFTAAVLPAWAERCGSACVASWNRLLAPIVGERLPER